MRLQVDNLWNKEQLNKNPAFSVQRKESKEFSISILTQLVWYICFLSHSPKQNGVCLETYLCFLVLSPRGDAGLRSKLGREGQMEGVKLCCFATCGAKGDSWPFVRACNRESHLLFHFSLCYWITLCHIRQVTSFLCASFSHICKTGIAILILWGWRLVWLN